MDDLAICLVSGGMDSLVSAAMAKRMHSRLAFLHLNYGQMTEEREFDSFHKIANHYGVEKSLRKVIDISFLSEIGGSALTDDSIAVPNYSVQDIPKIPPTYVPFRNTNIMAMAVSWAEVISAKHIYAGAVEEDGPEYPDCRKVYYKALNNLIRVGTRDGNIRVMTPVINMSKKDIVLEAFDLEAPLELTWSCYRSNTLACGVCSSCQLRLKGFRLAGEKDPLRYA